MPLHGLTTSRLLRSPLLGGPAIGDSNLAIDAATKLGLTTGLQLVLDAGDAASYTSGQSWLDRSGNGFDFFLGADGSATATDPTFTGTAGALDAYFAFDGGDYFTLDEANPTWVNNLHKDNAKWTIFAAFFRAGVSHGLFGTLGNSPDDIGVRWQVSSGGAHQIVFGNGSGTFALIGGSLGVMPVDEWSFIGASFDEAVGAGGVIGMVNGVFLTGTSTITSPSASDATYTTQIGSRGNNSALAASGSRMAIFIAWEGRALTQGELAALFNATRGRFGV